MHTLEPFYRWREKYAPEDDELSPFYGRTYNDSQLSQHIYNYYIHPRWDDFGSSTLYTKVLQADYEQGYAILEMLGEWNDTLYNDVEYLKRAVVDRFIETGISKFILICENVLNFHGSDDSYYEEWSEELGGGWICLVNAYDHVIEELEHMRLQYYIHFGKKYNGISWRPHTPEYLFEVVENLVYTGTKEIGS